MSAKKPRTFLSKSYINGSSDLEMLKMKIQRALDTQRNGDRIVVVIFAIIAKLRKRIRLQEVYVDKFFFCDIILAKKLAWEFKESKAVDERICVVIYSEEVEFLNLKPKNRGS